MKNKFWKYTSLLIIIGLVVWIWPRSQQHSLELQKAKDSIYLKQTLATNNQKVALSAATTQITGVARTAAEQTINDLQKTNEIIQSIEAKNSPISFFGKIVDQTDNPVSGAKVSSTIRQWYLKSPVTLDYGAHFIPVKTESDSNGRFEISGESGDGYGVGITKDGYHLSPKAPRGFGPIAGSFENPIVFKMWKEGSKEQLVGGSHVFGIDSGTVYTLDLLAAKKFEGKTAGDLQVSVTRPSIINSREKFSWSFSIEVIGGGLVEADPTDEFMYVAPESGYKQKIEILLDPKSTNWVGELKKNIFLRSREGKIFGRVQLDVYSIYNTHSAIEVNYVLNPNGSRNLQQ